MKMHTLNKLIDGCQVLHINLADEIMLNDNGRIIGIAQINLKCFKAYGSETSLHIMRKYYGKGFRGLLLTTPEIMITNWNNTLWK